MQRAGIDEPLAQSSTGLNYYSADGLGSITSLEDSSRMVRKLGRRVRSPGIRAEVATRRYGLLVFEFGCRDELGAKAIDSDQHIWLED